MSGSSPSWLRQTVFERLGTWCNLANMDQLTATVRTAIEARIEMLHHLNDAHVVQCRWCIGKSFLRKDRSEILRLAGIGSNTIAAHTTESFRKNMTHKALNELQRMDREGVLLTFFTL